jgi:RNA polymerase sigma factor (sigma-70 family)
VERFPARDWLDDAGVIELSISEPEAFGAIFDRHGPHIHRYVARRLGHDAADDLLSEAFVAAFRRRRSYARDCVDARPWLYGIAANLIRQHRREEVRRLRLQASARAERDQPGPADAADDRVSAQASRKPLLAALAGLAHRDREVLLLVAWEDLSYPEVAQALNIPIGTVRSRLHRARRQMRADLPELDPMTQYLTAEEILNRD